jgi:hypothetical protein
MTAKVPRNLAEARQQEMVKLGYLNLSFDPDNQRVFSFLRPALVPSLEVVMLSTQVTSKKFGLKSLKIGKKALTDGWLIVTDRRLILLSAATRYSRQYPLEKIRRFSRPTVQAGGVRQMLCVLEMVSEGGSEDLRIMFAIKGLNELALVGQGMLSGFIFSIDELLGLSIMNNQRQDVNEEIAKASAYIKALDSVFETAYSFKNV